MYEKPPKERLEELYYDKRKSMSEIAEVIDVSPSTIQNWMEYYEIERRSQSEATQLRDLKNPVVHYRTDHNGYETWQNQFQGSTDIVLVHRLIAVAEHGFNEVGESIVHHKNGVRWDNRPENLEVLESHSEHIKKHLEERYSESPWRNEELMRELHHEKGLSMPEMATRLDCTRTTITKWLDKHGISKRRLKNEPDHVKMDALDAKRTIQAEHDTEGYF